MDLHEYITLDGFDLVQAVKNKEVTPKELVALSFEQLGLVNESLNITTSVREKEALYEAERLRDDGNQPLFGVPVLLKDISQALAGERLTSGTKLLENHIAKTSSNFVKRLQQSGCLFTGHTGTPEFALKNITESKLHGPTRNPWNRDYSPGGSSGGASAAVAAGVVPIAGASDGGGSIRIPASYTSLFGLKPTRGRMPVGPGVGRQWQGASIDFVLTKSVRDSALVLDHMQVVQEEAAFQTPLYEAGFMNSLEKDLRKPLRIGYSTRSPVGTPVSEEAKKSVHNVLSYLESNGCLIEEAEPKVDGKELMQNYFLMNCGEMGAVIERFEEELSRPLTTDDLEIESWLLKEAGKSVNAAQFSRSLAAWDEAAAQMAAYHQTYDLYITPATAFPAPKIGELTKTKEWERELVEQMNEAATSDAKQAVLWDMFLPSLTYTPFTQLANLTGQPAISLPVHLTDEQLPIGVQVVARKGHEALLLQVAHLIEQSELWVGMKGNPYYTNESS